jgi:membrane protease YdiL (CAAX protease family)
VTSRTPRLTWSRPAREVRDGSPWFVASTGMLRAPWRLSVFAAAFVMAWVLANSFLYPVLTLVTSGLTTPPPLYPWLMLTATLAATVIALRQVDEQEWSDIALGAESWRVSRLLRGVCVGGLAICATVALLVFTGGAAFAATGEASTMTAWASTALRAAALLAPAALWEELVFRGYLWRVAEQSGGPRTALVFTSITFGLVHLLNPGANVRTLGLVMVAGVCLGVVRMATNSVPAAWLAHFAWNFVMAAVVHAPVSGLPFDASGWHLVPTGPAWWSGGAWGPEGGLASALVLCSALGAYAVLSSRARPTNFSNRRAQSFATAPSGSR